jgi:hypothetical protein
MDHEFITPMHSLIKRQPLGDRSVREWLADLKSVAGATENVRMVEKVLDAAAQSETIIVDPPALTDNVLIPGPEMLDTVTERNQIDELHQLSGQLMAISTKLRGMESGDGVPRMERRIKRTVTTNVAQSGSPGDSVNLNLSDVVLNPSAAVGLVIEGTFDGSWDDLDYDVNNIDTLGVSTAVDAGLYEESSVAREIGVANDTFFTISMNLRDYDFGIAPPAGQPVKTYWPASDIMPDLQVVFTNGDAASGHLLFYKVTVYYEVKEFVTKYDEVKQINGTTWNQVMSESTLSEVGPLGEYLRTVSRTDVPALMTALEASWLPKGGVTSFDIMEYIRSEGGADGVADTVALVAGLLVAPSAISKKMQRALGMRCAL